jgi:hypothetical protein
MHNKVAPVVLKSANFNRFKIHSVNPNMQIEIPLQFTLYSTHRRIHSMAATSSTAIPDGMTFKRTEHFGSHNYLFNDFTWTDKADEEADGENPIYLFTSEPYLTGTLADLHLVQHQVVASTFLNHLDVDLDDLEPKNYPVDAFFWSDHPRVIPTMHCGGKRRRHLDEPADVFCFSCDGQDLDFDRPRLTDLLHTFLKWPFPPASVLTTRTTRKPIDTSSVADLQQVAVYIKPHLQVAEQLLDEQDVAKPLLMRKWNQSVHTRSMLNASYAKRQLRRSRVPN